MTRSRFARSESSHQIDAFSTPVPLAKAPPAEIPPSRRQATPRQAWRSPAPGPIAEPQELWLAVHLPQLPLRMQNGMADERGTRKLLEQLATSSQRFTPRVSFAPPDGLLLEVKGSLNLFGGITSLRAAVESLHRSAGLEPVMAIAPTPLAALACARAHRAETVLDRAHLLGPVASLALATLRWPEKVLQRLAKIGVYTIGQALRLPRAGFARRFGVAQLASLDRLTGRAADPQMAFQPRERFHRRRELGYEIEDQALVLEAIAPLLRDLQRFLQRRQCGITWLECRLRHRRAAPTLCLLRLAEPAADAQRLQILLGEKLLTLALPEPVRACELRTSFVEPRPLASNEIWLAGEHGGETRHQSRELVEYLRARLGDEAVYGLRLAADHRPERQSLFTPALPSLAKERNRPPFLGKAGVEPGSAALRRPLWLLATPQLSGKRIQELIPGAEVECIEAGWGNGKVTRDYYAVRDPRGVRYWVFRERNAPHRWFVQGIFG